MNQAKKIKDKRHIFNWAIFVLLILVLFILVYIQIINFFVLDRVKVYTEVVVGENPGFDLNKTALTFGKIVPGNGASRGLIIKNNFERNVAVEITSSGEISAFLTASENNFILMPREIRNVSFSVFFPSGSEMKKYGGWIDIKLKNG
ncbi:MAG: hypothetical protein WCP89_02955 [archaeon]